MAIAQKLESAEESRQKDRMLTESEELRTKDRSVDHDLLDRVEKRRIDEVSKSFRCSGSLHKSLQSSQQRFQESSLIER